MMKIPRRQSLQEVVCAAWITYYHIMSAFLCLFPFLATLCIELKETSSDPLKHPNSNLQTSAWVSRWKWHPDFEKQENKSNLKASLAEAVQILSA